MMSSSVFTPSSAAVLVSVVAMGELLLLWRILRAARSWRHVEERVAHFSKVLTLLTETTEAGFGAMATELRRQEETAPARPTHPWHRRRPATTPGRAQPARDVARPAQTSEGEASLRQYLQGREHAYACPCASCATDTAAAGAR
jgi:hypothetical protein